MVSWSSPTPSLLRIPWISRGWSPAPYHGSRAMSQEGQLPLILSTLNIHSCPVAAVIQMLIFASILIIPSDLILLINYVGFTDWIQLGLMMMGLLKLRFQEPNLSRPYKVSQTKKKKILYLFKEHFVLLILFSYIYVKNLFNPLWPHFRNIWE